MTREPPSFKMSLPVSAFSFKGPIDWWQLTHSHSIRFHEKENEGCSFSSLYHDKVFQREDPIVFTVDGCAWTCLSLLTHCCALPPSEAEFSHIKPPKHMLGTAETIGKVVLFLLCVREPKPREVRWLAKDSKSGPWHHQAASPLPNPVISPLGEAKGHEEKAPGSGEKLEAKTEESLEQKLFLPFCAVPEFPLHRKASLLPADAPSPRTFPRPLRTSVSACPFRSPFLGLTPVSFTLFYTWVKWDTEQFIFISKSCPRTPIQFPFSPGSPCSQTMKHWKWLFTLTFSLIRRQSLLTPA